MKTIKMKDSGIEWIGEIPEDWKLINIGSLFQCRNEKVNDTDYPPLSVSKAGIVPQIETVAKSDANDNRKKVLKNDFVINSRSDRKQSCGLSDFDGSVSLINTVLYVIDDKTIFPQYTNYILKNYGFSEEFYRWGHGIVADLWTTRWQEMKSIVLPLPTIAKQKHIISTLKEKLTAIDKLIANQQGQIEKLKEYKQAIITQAVTKGLNPSAPMKDSGVEWIGEIPEGWKVSVLKRICIIRTGGTLSKNGNVNYYSEYGLPWIKPDNLNGFKPIEKTEEYLNEIGEKLIVAFPPLTLFVCCIGTIGKIGYSTKMAYCNQQINGLIFNEEIVLTKFGMYAVCAQEKQHWFYANGNVVKILNSSNQGKINIVVPPIEEQQQIADYLDNKCEQIDKLISIKQAKIEKLNEYKKSLIYEYVTGKKEVV